MNPAGLAARLAFATSLGAIALGSVTGSLTAAQAQARGPVQRIVQGKVESKDGANVKGAVVYLKDGHTASIKTAIVDDQGAYRFVQLSQNTDYEVWAQLGDKKGSSKTISSFDTKNDLTINLKVD